MARGSNFADSGTNSGRISGTFLGFPLEGFGFFTSLLLALSSGFFTFFLVTALSIFGLLVWNQILHHNVNYANSYLFFAFRPPSPCGRLPSRSLERSGFVP